MSTPWAARRNTIYLSVVVGFFVIVFGIPLLLALQREPTCFDGKQNHDEQGPDCGGSCSLLCEFQVKPLSIQWARSFKAGDGVYNATAFIENPNFNAAVMEVPYVFKLYDERNVLVVEREGSTFISTDGITPIFEARISTGESDITRTFFEFTGPIRWHRIRDEKLIKNLEHELITPFSSPRINAVIENEDINELIDVEVVGVVFNTKGNAIAASQTYIDFLPKLSKETIFFTWREPFVDTVGRVDVIPRIPPKQTVM